MQGDIETEPLHAGEPDRRARRAPKGTPPAPIEVEAVPVPMRTAGPGQVIAGEDVVDVEVEVLGVRPSFWQRVGGRIWRVFAPIGLGMLLDTGDLATNFPIPFLTFPVGLIAGYLLGGFLKLAPTWRIVFAVVTGGYWAAPFTGLLPIGTIAGVAVQFFERDRFYAEPMMDGGAERRRRD